MISWEQCREDFVPDGALRDIYVLDVGIEDWRKFYVALLCNRGLEYFVDGSSQTLPATVEDIFTARETASALVSISIAEVDVRCHFFCTDQIELSFDPQAVATQAAFDEVLGLLRLIGNAVHKRVLLTHENCPQNPFLVYDSTSKEFTYQSLTR